MKISVNYREQAAKCRKIARQITLQEPRDELLRMAQHWERLADERQASLERDAAEPAAKPDLPEDPTSE